MQISVGASSAEVPNAVIPDMTWLAIRLLLIPRDLSARQNEQPRDIVMRTELLRH